MGKEKKTSFLVIALMILITALIYFFLGVKYNLSFFEKIIISLVSLGLFYFFARKGFSRFSLFAFSSITIFIGLAIAFASPNTGDSPIRLDIILGAWPTFILSLISSLTILFIYEKMKSKSKYEVLLFGVYLIFWALIAINARYFEGWMSENLLVIPFLIIIYFLHRWFKFSKISYSLIFLFMVLHVVGSHYTYSEVPLGEWMRQFFDLSRNHYDRVVHLCFGLLWAYPIREISMRIGNLKGFWAVWIPVEFILALSCVFELIEWAFVVAFGGDLGIAYLGTQGDIWDAQKDMALAGLGSIITMLITSSILIYYNARDFAKEFKQSLYVKSKKVLGEEALIKVIGRKK